MAAAPSRSYMVGSGRMRSIRPRVWIVVVAMLLIAAPGCGDEPIVLPPSALPRVMVISVDGLRPDAISVANMTTLQRIANDGAASLAAQTVSPSLTLPSHTSMVTGLVPARHGVTWNDDLTASGPPVNLTTVFDILASANLTTAFFGGKSKLRTFVHPTAPTVTSLPPTNEIWLADRVAQQFVSYLNESGEKANFIFVHLPDVDLAGHQFGWMSGDYLAAARRADDAVAKIWSAARAKFGTDLTLIITADHGGVGTAHDNGFPESTRTPWITWGRSVVPQPLGAGLRAVDIAPTVLWLLRVTVPDGWDGVPAKGAFNVAGVEGPTKTNTVRASVR